MKQYKEEHKIDNTYMRQTVMVQKLNEKPHPTTAIVHTDNPTPMSLNGLTLQFFIHA